MVRCEFVRLPEFGFDFSLRPFAVVLPEVREVNVLIFKQLELDFLRVSEVERRGNVSELNAVVLPHVLGELGFKFRQVIAEFGSLKALPEHCGLTVKEF